MVTKYTLFEFSLQLFAELMIQEESALIPIQEIDCRHELTVLHFNC